MKPESLRDAAENLACAQIEAMYGYVSWRQTYDEFHTLVLKLVQDEKFIARFQKGRVW